MSYFEVNLNAVRKKDPATADWIDSAAPLDWLETISNADGQANLLLRLGANKLPAYDLGDPMAKPIQEAERHEFKRNCVSIVLGAGAGHMIKAVLDRAHDKHSVLAAEVHPLLIKTALSTYDFSDDILADRLLFFKPDALELKKALRRLGLAKIGHELPIALWEAYAQVMGGEYNDLAQMVTESMSMEMSLLKTLSSRGLMVSQNQLLSLVKAIRTPGAASLFGQYEGRPAMVIGAGPSLLKNIDQIKRAKGKAVIIAVAQALRTLLAHDVVPDLICAVDMQPHSLNHVKGLLATDNVPLLVSCNAFHEYLTKWQGPSVISGINMANARPGHFMPRLWKHKGLISLDQAVSHLAIRSALALGADPIVFAGLDLAVDNDGVDHCSQYIVPSEGIAKEDLPAGAGVILPSVPVKGYYGQTVQSRTNWVSQLRHIEKIVEGAEDTRFINATEGGVRIEGTDQLAMADVVTEICTEPLDLTPFDRLSEPDPDTDRLIEEAIEMLARELDTMEAVRSTAPEALDNNRRMRKMLDRDRARAMETKKFRRYLRANDKLTEQTRLQAEKMPVLMDSIFGAYRQAAFFNPEGESDAVARMELGLNRNEAMLTAALEATDQLLGTSEQVLDTLRRYQSTAAREGQEPESASAQADLAEIFTETGFMDDAEKAYRRAVELDSSNPTHRHKLAHLLITREKFSAALELIEASAQPESAEAETLRQAVDGAMASLLDEADSHLAKDRYGYPLIIARKCLAARPDFDRARKIYDRAVELRDEAEAAAAAKATSFRENDADRLAKEEQYQILLAESKRLGQENHDFDGSLKLLEQAIDLCPDKIQARWGLATTLHHLGRLDESLAAYQELVELKPKDRKYRFEMGLVLLKMDRTEDGMAMIEGLMQKTNQFDSFLPQMALLHRQQKRHQMALEAYHKYLARFSADYQAWAQQGDCLAEMGRLDQAIESYDQALKFKPDFRHALAHKSQLVGIKRQMSPRMN